MKQETKPITLSELAKLAFELPVGGDIQFSCREDEDFWAIQKRQIFDGPLLIVGSYGGGLTSSLDIQIDNCLEETEKFLYDILLDRTGDEVFVEASTNSVSRQFRERLLNLKVDTLQQIRELIDATERYRWDFENFATDPILIKRTDIGGNFIETPLCALAEGVSGLKVFVCCADGERRICSVCGKRMAKGYCVDGGVEYFCSDECLHTKHSHEEWVEKFNDGDSYWTEWGDCTEPNALYQHEVNAISTDKWVEILTKMTK